MLENSQNLFQSFKTFVFHPLRVQNTKKQPVQTTGIVEVEIVTWESSTKKMDWKWNFETGFDSFEAFFSQTLVVADVK